MSALKENEKHVQKGGHDVSTGKGPHTKAEPKHGMGAGDSGHPKSSGKLNVTEHDSHESDHKMGGGEKGAGLAGAPSGTRAAQSQHMTESHNERRGEKTVKGGRGTMKSGSVDADHVIGDGGAIRTAGAEGFSDMASSKANRKEAGEPEREANEQAAMGRERSVPSKNTMGWGERETVGKNTI